MDIRGYGHVWVSVVRPGNWTERADWYRQPPRPQAHGLAVGVRRLAEVAQPEAVGEARGVGVPRHRPQASFRESHKFETACGIGSGSRPTIP